MLLEKLLTVFPTPWALVAIVVSRVERFAYWYNVVEYYGSNQWISNTPRKIETMLGIINWTKICDRLGHRS